MKKEKIGVTYTDDDPVEITLGIWESCDNYVPFIRLVTGNADRVYQCLTCKANHKQHINGKITFKYLDDLYTIKNAGSLK
jgi:hypothetical protein